MDEAVAYTQKFGLPVSARHGSRNRSGIAKNGMFISRMPSTATPRTTSTISIRSDSATGEAAGVGATAGDAEDDVMLQYRTHSLSGKEA